MSEPTVAAPADPKTMTNDERKAMVAEIKNRWRSRVTSMGYSKGKRRLVSQADFMAGAMSALVALGYSDNDACPPGLVLPTMTGRDLCDD